MVLGVGNPMRGDDGFGPALAARLSGRLACPVLDCGSAPENFTGKVRALSPETVLVVDAAEMGAPAGEAHLVAPGQVGASGLSTHAAGLAMLFDYLEAQCGTSGWLLAVQPGEVKLGAGLSPPVAASAERLAGLLEEVLGPGA